MEKYALKGSQTQYQAGSNNLVLRNKLGITQASDMNEAETVLLLKLYQWLFSENSPPDTVTMATLKTWHRQWLGNIYEWAGDERSVNMSKGSFHFAAANKVASLLVAYEQMYLSPFADLDQYPLDKIVELIAESHIEFILIHPFREGNGRLSRVLVDAMAVKAGYGLMDYRVWDQHKEYYFKAIQAGVASNTSYMQRLVRDGMGLNP